MNLEKLIENVKANDQESMKELLKQFSPLVKCYAKFLVYEDAIQELNFHLISKVKAMTWLNEGAAKKYIKTVVYQKYLKLKMESDKQKLESVGLEALEDVASYDDYQVHDNIPFEVLLEREEYIVKKRYYEGYSDQEIAKQMSLTRQQVFNIRNKALRTLKKEIEKNSKNILQMSRNEDY